MIPRTIFTTWHTKELPVNMKHATDCIKQLNPEFDYRLYDFDECRKFIIENYDASVIDAFDRLKPASYKSDLWRYCILYTYGGIYMDIKFTPINGFKFIDLIDNETFCRDMHQQTTAFTGLIICESGNPTMLRCIRQIVKNVNELYYGLGSLDPTGPILLTNCMESSDIQKLGNLRLSEDIYILYKNKKILMRYIEYREEQKQFQITPHYDYMWRNRDIYISDIVKIENDSNITPLKN